MHLSDGTAVVAIHILLRLTAALVFTEMYLRERRGMHILLAVSWLLYASAAAVHLSVVSDLLDSVVLVSAAFELIAITFIIVSALSYIRPNILHAGPKHSAIMLLLLSPALLMAGPNETVVYFVSLQAFILLTTAGVLWFDRKAAYDRLGRSVYALVCVVVLELGTVAANLTDTIPTNIDWIAGAATTVVMLMFFVYAEHNQAVRRWNETAQRLAQAESLAKTGYWERNMFTEEAYWSIGHFKIFGVSDTASPLRMSDINSMIHPDDLQEAMNSYRRLRQGSPYERKEFRIVLPDGQIRWIKNDTTQHDGVEHWLFGVVQDITETKNLELRLKSDVHRCTLQTEALHASAQLCLELAHIAFTFSSPQADEFDSDSEIGDGSICPASRYCEGRLQLLSQLLNNLSPLLQGNQVSLRSYLSMVLENLPTLHYNVDLKPETDLEIRDIDLPVEHALLVVIVVCEAIRNSCTHGRGTSDTVDPDIRIRIRGVLSQNTYHLTIEDTGVGFPKTMVPLRLSHHKPQTLPSNYGFGLKVMELTTSRFGADIELNNVTGARIAVQFLCTPDSGFVGGDAG